MTKTKRPPLSREARDLRRSVLSDNARFRKENRRLREALELLSEYSHDCNHDVIAQTALHPAEPVWPNHSICPPGKCLYP